MRQGKSVSPWFLTSQRAKQRKFSLKPDDLFKTADVLVNQGVGAPLEANLRRAVSSVYYALFHTLAEDAANLLIGKPQVGRSNSAWRQTYRALQHRKIKNCFSNNKQKQVLQKFPQRLQNFAALMASMQSKRHLADYDPLYKSLSRSSVQSDLAAAKAAVRAYKGAAKYDRRAFCAFMLFDLRD